MKTLELTEQEITMIKSLVENEKIRLTNTDYNSDVIKNVDEKIIIANELFHKILTAK